MNVSVRELQLYCTEDRLGLVSRDVKKAASLALQLSEQAIPDVQFTYEAPRKAETYASHLKHQKIGGTPEHPLVVETVSGISIHPLLVAQDARESVLSMSPEQRKVYETRGFTRPRVLARQVELAALGLATLTTVQALHNIIYVQDDIEGETDEDLPQRKANITAILDFAFTIHELP